MKSFAWSHGRFSSYGDPQVVGEELERLRASQGGTLRPSDVVEAAQEPSSPLHHLFSWDDARAAQQYREQQARVVIRAIRVKVLRSDREENRRIYVHVHSEDDAGYMPVEVVRSSDFLRAQVVAQARAGLAQWRERYQELAEELPDLFGAIGRFVDEEAEGPRRAAKRRAGKERLGPERSDPARV